MKALMSVMAGMEILMDACLKAGCVMGCVMGYAIMITGDWGAGVTLTAACILIANMDGR